MNELATIAALLSLLGEAHHDLGNLYTELATTLEPLRPVDNDTLTLARAIQGEEAGRFGDRREELGEWIAHTALNRWGKTWWWEIDGEPCTFSERVEKDWHGTRLVEKPEPWAMAIARRVMEEHRQGNREDKAEGALFAMTLEDLENHGWTENANPLTVRIILEETKLGQLDLGHDFVFMTGDPAKPNKEN